MVEEDSTTPVRSLDVSISFGRFENDLLSWEKWSSFSQNKYLEEVEKCATPGSVAEKKAYFEARNKLIAVRKAEMLNKQMEACQELNEENEIQNIRGVDQYDEEVTADNIYRIEMCRPDMNQHSELETTIFVSRDFEEKDVIKEISANQFITDQTIHTSEKSCPLIDDCSENKITSVILESGMLNKDDPEFDKYDGQSEAENIQEEPILKSDPNGCETDHPLNIQTSILGYSQTHCDIQVGDSSGVGSKVHIHIDALEVIKDEVNLNSVLSPDMLKQLKVDDACLSKSPSTLEGDHVNVKFKSTEDICKLKTEKIDVEPGGYLELPNISDCKSLRSQKTKPAPQKSSNKNGVENVKKTLVSSVPRTPQITNPRILKPSTPTAKSGSRLLPVSRVKNTSASAPVVPKSSQVANATNSTSHSTAPPLKPPSLSPFMKGADLLSSRKKSISTGVSRKLTPTSLHMSLNFSSKVPSSSTLVMEPRKSLFIEKMGDKDIVKRAFRTFQSISTPLIAVSIENDVKAKQVRNKTDGKPSTLIKQTEKARLIKKGEVDVKSKKASSIFKSDNPSLHSKEDRRMEAKKVTGKTECKEPAKSHLLAKYKGYGENHTGDRRRSLPSRSTSQSGLS